MAKAPKNTGVPWLPADIKLIRQLVKQNTPTRIIALKMGRSTSAVYQRASIEGASLKPTNQRPYGTRKK
jgi:hypothetical protein